MDRTPSWFQNPIPAPTRRIGALSLFSGCGGFCEGIDLAGFEVRGAVEKDPYACQTYRLNFPKIPLFEGDIHAYTPLDGSGPDVDLVFGGPPCQGFSQIGTRRLDDSRNTLYQQYLRVVEAVRPKVFLMENVPNLVLLNRGFFRDLILNDFRRRGYTNTVVLRVCASDYGVPQDRNRVIFVGTRDDLALDGDLGEICAASLDALKCASPFTVWDAISDLPRKVVHSGETMAYPEPGKLSDFQRLMRLDCDYGVYPMDRKRERGIGPEDSRLHNHHTKEIQERRRILISHLKPGLKGDSLPKGLWNGLRPEKWRRLHPDRPAYTILAQMHRDLSEWVHPKLERWITVREAARLQSFHDGFVFQGSEWQQLKQIGNAVPPLLAGALGLMARELLAATSPKRKRGPSLRQSRLALQTAA